MHRIRAAYLCTDPLSHRPPPPQLSLSLTLHLWRLLALLLFPRSAVVFSLVRSVFSHPSARLPSFYRPRKQILPPTGRSTIVYVVESQRAADFHANGRFFVNVNYRRSGIYEAGDTLVPLTSPRIRFLFRFSCYWRNGIQFLARFFYGITKSWIFMHMYILKYCKNCSLQRRVIFSAFADLWRDRSVMWLITWL